MPVESTGRSGVDGRVDTAVRWCELGGSLGVLLVYCPLFFITMVILIFLIFSSVWVQHAGRLTRLNLSGVHASVAGAKSYVGLSINPGATLRNCIEKN